MSESRKYTVSEIAKARGVSERAIYKQLKSHAEELEGHIEKIQGKQWLDEYAVELLEKAAVNSAPAVVETIKEREVQALKDEIDRLNKELDDDRKALQKAADTMSEIIKTSNENAKLAAESKLYIEQRDNAEKEILHLRVECQQIKNSVENEKEEAVRVAKEELEKEFKEKRETWEQELKKRSLKEKWNLLFGK